MLPPLPSNLITLPACRACNNGFSFDENVVRTLLSLVGIHPHLIEERQPGAWLERTLKRNPKIKTILDASRRSDGSYQLVGQLFESFRRVFFKTTQGMFYGLYDRIVRPEQLRLLRVEDQRFIKPEEVIANIRPNPLVDLTDQPLPEISPHSWHTREPIFTMELVDPATGKKSQRVFRLVRDTPVEWVCFQPDIFSVAFVKCDEGCACVMDLWKTLVVTIKAPWPDDRGALRKGRKNPLSRDKKRP
jgi:hypothetical protein